MKYKIKYNLSSKRGFTVLFIFLALIFSIFFAFMRQTDQIIETTYLQKRISNQLRENDLSNIIKVNGIKTDNTSLPAEK